MLYFKQNRSLHMQYDQMIQAALDGWTMGEIYAVRDNEMVFLLENGQIRFYAFDEGVFKKKDYTKEFRASFEQVDAEEWKADSLLAKISQFLLLLIRRSYQIAPYADKHMETVLLGKLNKSLESTGVVIQTKDEDGIIPIFLLQGQQVTLEAAVEAVIQAKNAVGQPIIKYIQVPVIEEVPVKGKRKRKKEAKAEETKAKKVASAKTVKEEPVKTEPIEAEEEPVKQEPIKEEIAKKEPVAAEKPTKEETAVSEEPVKEEPIKEEPAKEEPAKEELPAGISEEHRESFLKAKALFASLIGGAKEGSEVYHSMCFSMGEIMYYRDELASAAYFYGLCDIEKVEDKDDYYERLGHCFLDDKMSDFAPALKLHYRASHNEGFRDSHKEELAGGVPFSSEEMEQYRLTCIKVGRERYKQSH